MNLIEIILEEAKLWDEIVHVDLKDDFMNEYLAREHANHLREQVEQYQKSLVKNLL